jgi:hypothetical protein
MSYKNAVLRDNPLSFWPLDGTTSGQQATYGNLLLQYGTYQDYLDDQTNYSQSLYSTTINDESNYERQGAYALGNLIFQDVTPLITHHNYDTYFSGCKITDSVSIENLNTYNVFQKNYENKTFGIEFLLLIQDTTDSDNVIMTLNAGTHQRMKIYANSDFLYFTLNFSNGESVTTKKQVSSWDKPINVFAVVKDKLMSIYVNSVTDEIISIPNDYQYYADSNTRFKVGPASSGMSFTINGLAFYDKILSPSQLLNHMFWVERDSSPTNYSNQIDISHFNFNLNSGKTIFSKQFVDSTTYNLGSLSNIITDKSGITLAKTTSSETGIGTWTYPLAISSYSDFVGAEISWDSGAYNYSSSGNYVVVEVSYDNGTTYFKVNNGKTFPYFLSNFSSTFSAQCLIRVTIYSSDTSIINQPRLDNLNIKIYSSIDEISDSGLFRISPAPSSTYMIKNDDSNILTRSKNLGILFSSQDPMSNPGYATISKTTSSTYQSIEFWMRYDGLGSAVLDTNTGTTDLYIDNSNVLQNTIVGSTLYVNGVNRNSSPITLTNGEIYHVVLVYPSTKSSNILLNSSHDVSKTPSEATYGYITIYPNSLTSSQVNTRYLSFISVVAGVVRDNTSPIGQLQEYSGTNDQANNGQAVIYHTHIQ